MKWTNKGHQFDEIGKMLQDKKIYIFGTGKNGKYVLEHLLFLGGAVKGFIDTDKEKWGKEYCGYQIYTLNEALQHRENTIIIVAMSFQNEINVMRKLMACGLKNGEDFFWHESFLEIYLPIYAAYGYGKVFHKGIVICPTRKCTLNCENCLNFIPYIEEPSEDNIDMMKEDLDRLFACIDYLKFLSIVGGETLLYSEYKELFRYIGEKYRKQIHLLAFTTSTALKIPDEETFDILKKYDFTVHISDYRRALPQLEENYNKWIEALKAHEVQFVQFVDHDWIDLDVFRKEDMWKTEEERIEHFDACSIPWNFYRGGKLWSCAWAGLAVMAGTKEDNPHDYYDLHSCTWKEDEYNFKFEKEKYRELMEFGMGYMEKGYMEMCSKCNGNTTINTHFVPPAVQIPRKNGFSFN